MVKSRNHQIRPLKTDYSNTSGWKVSDLDVAPTPPSHTGPAPGHRLGTGLIYVYLVLKGVPLRTSQVKHILRLLARETLRVPVGRGSCLAAADTLARLNNSYDYSNNDY